MFPSGRSYRKSISWLVDHIFPRRRRVRRAPRRRQHTQTRWNVRDAAGPASVADTTRLRGTCITARRGGDISGCVVGQAVASRPARHSGCVADAARCCLRGACQREDPARDGLPGTRPASPAFSSGGSFIPKGRPVRKAVGRSHMGHQPTSPAACKGLLQNSSTGRTNAEGSAREVQRAIGC
jgi:hypothetical protein